MYKDTKNFVRSCTICLYRKNAFKIPPAPHQPVEQSQEPGETCHIDISVLLRPPKGGRYPVRGLNPPRSRGQFTGPKRQIRRSPNVSFNNSIMAQAVLTCCAVLLEPQLLDIMIVQLRNENVSNHGSIPITIDCNVVAFIVFEEVRTNDSTSP
ncbi:uncharacterized protein TNCV_1380251 [Trichonephila clavipes]|nr:uncharacterized protein TNCV_1380251 [Trichonephila clavipes]